MLPWGPGLVSRSLPFQKRVVKPTKLLWGMGLRSHWSLKPPFSAPHLGVEQAPCKASCDFDLRQSEPENLPGRNFTKPSHQHWQSSLGFPSIVWGNVHGLWFLQVLPPDESALVVVKAQSTSLKQQNLALVLKHIGSLCVCDKIPALSTRWAASAIRIIANNHITAMSFCLSVYVECAAIRVLLFELLSSSDGVL